jgi:hypothetical protein
MRLATIVRALPFPWRLIRRLEYFSANVLPRKYNNAASEKAHRKCALPMRAPLVPYIFPLEDFYANHQIAPEWFNRMQKPIRCAGDVFVIDLHTIAVQDADIHGSCM